MTVTLDGMVTDFKPSHFSKAPLPIAVTLDGIETEVRLPQP